MRNMLNVRYRFVDKQQIKHVTLSAQVTFLFFYYYHFFFCFCCGSAAGNLSFDVLFVLFSVSD